jgi:amino acid permease
MQIKVRSWKLEVRRNIFVLFFIFLSFSANAQCAMCRAALESEGNTVKSEAVNDGIVYLMAIPYLLVAFVGYAVYRVFKKKPSSESSN